MLRAILIGVLFSFSVVTTAQAELITFDVNQAGFVAPAAGSGNAGRVIVDDQFASIGVLFRDMDYPTLGVWVGNPTGPLISSPNVLYSNDGSSSTTPDFLVRVELRFVDPADINTPAYVTSISGVFTDAGAGSTLTAYDTNNTVLGVATALTGSNETLSLTGIGQIARAEFVAQDLTALDNIDFDAVVSGAPAAPVPTMSTYGIVLTIFGLFFFASRRLRATARHS